MKTINISQKEVCAREQFTRRDIATQLDGGFFLKLRGDIAEAEKQMHAYDATGEARHSVYIIPCFDDFLGEYKEGYFLQIDQYLSASPIQGIELIFHNDQTPFHKPLAMATATVVNAC